MSDDCGSAFSRIVENIPIIGHLVSMCHACAKKPAHAERAGMKATVGLLFCLCNCPAEAVDEGIRKISPKLYSYSLTARPEWMKKYHHYTLRQICLPGSHQSTTYHLQKKLSSLPMASGWAKCQELSLSAQLSGGIRFLDLRIMSDDKGEIWTHHNVMTCLNLKQILETVRAFIVDHPTEIIGMFINNDSKHIDWPTCISIINEYIGERLIHEHMRDMLIGDIVDQGKNIFVSGIPNVAFSWKNLQPHWPNKQWPDELHDDLENTLAEFYETSPKNYFWYKAECTPGTHMIVRSVGGVPGAAAHKCTDEKFEFIEDMASAANLLINDILNQIETIPFNVMSIDFVQDEIVDRIIELNGKTSEHDETVMLTASTENILSAVPSETRRLLSSQSPDGSYLSSQNSSSLKAHSVAFSPEGAVYATPMKKSARNSLNTSVRSQNRSYQSSANTSGRHSATPSNRHSNTSSARLSNMSTRSAGRSGARASHNVSVRSSHNTTTGSLALEMPLKKAPPLEVKETTM